MHKSKGRKHNLVLDRQKAKEFLARREELRHKRLQNNNVMERSDGKLVHSTGRKMENDDV